MVHGKGEKVTNLMITTESVQLQTIAHLTGLAYKEISLPPGFQTLVKPEVQGELKLANRFFALAQLDQPLGQLRTVTVQSPKISILNLLFFPDPKQQLPAYAAEFVSLSGKPIVAVIDTKCLIPAITTEKVNELMIQARNSVMGDTISDTAIPEWFKASRSGHEIFARPKSVSDMETLMAKHLEIWHNLVELIKSCHQYNETDKNDHQTSLARYKEQHRHNYPGIPLLQRSFGKAWTKKYLNNYLFR
jgi:Ferredoxin-dependent bilin reductase